MSDDTIKLKPGYRKTATEEKMLRQFSNVDGPKGATAAYVSGWDRIFGGKAANEPTSVKHAATCTSDEDCATCGRCEVCNECECD